VFPICGWSAWHPIHFTQTPTKRSDIVREVRGIRGNFAPDDVFPTEAAALRRAVKLFTDYKAMAERCLAKWPVGFWLSERRRVEKMLNVAEGGILALAG
jgi:hypothetical protein